jgi:hypothetical protein
MTETQRQRVQSSLRILPSHYLWQDSSQVCKVARSIKVFGWRNRNGWEASKRNGDLQIAKGKPGRFSRRRKKKSYTPSAEMFYATCPQVSNAYFLRAVQASALLPSDFGSDLGIRIYAIMAHSHAAPSISFVRRVFKALLMSGSRDKSPCEATGLLLLSASENNNVLDAGPIARYQSGKK